MDPMGYTQLFRWRYFASFLLRSWRFFRDSFHTYHPDLKGMTGGWFGNAIDVARMLHLSPVEKNQVM